MTDLHRQSARELAASIASREVSSREALDHLLDRVETLDGPINSVVTIDADRARSVADACDSAVANGSDLGPLHGVPMTVKDSYMTAGMRTTSGAPDLSDYVPEEDAWPVRALRDAGAVIYGKTNLPIYAGDLQTYNEIFGTTNNPYDTTTTPGGSSGGSAAALACGFTPLELGSDIGGSIRFPSHFTGVAGHKPSFGIVPAHGQIPGPPGTLTLADLAVAGPMARDVADLELGLDVMIGPNRWDGAAWRLELPDARQSSIAGYRVAAWLDDEACPVESESRELLDRAAAALAEAGAKVDADARPGFSLEKAASTFTGLLQAALSGGYTRQQVERFAADEGEGPVSDTRRYVSMRHREWLSNNERRMQMRKHWEDFFSEWDIALLPVCPRPAIGHDHSEPQSARLVSIGGKDCPYWNMGSWMAPAGACYLPATTVPVGLTEAGLPVGIQIVGPFLEDRTTLHLAAELTNLLDPLPAPPGF